MFEINEDYFCQMDSSTMRIQSKKPASVIITIPHDPVSRLSDWQGFLTPRKFGIFGRDKNLYPIFRDMTSQTRKLSIVRPFFSRAFIDYNRSSNDPVEPASIDHRLQQFYSNYHNAIEYFIERALKVYGANRCLLIDAHGFKEQPFEGIDYDIILGTDHRKTIRSGFDIDKQLAFFLRHRGYQVYLPTEEKVFGEKYSGAFTARHYAAKYRINAIQIEIARKFRTKNGLEFGIKLSKDFADFINQNF